MDALPAQSRRLLHLAAADPSGDRALVWRAAGRLGIPFQAAGPAEEAGLVQFSGLVRFRHPLVRSAAYRSAPLAVRQQMHAVLAEVTDPRADPDRRAWHRAQAASGPDEEVAAELERCAGRAQARGGLAAAAAFLERSVLLTADPARLAERALTAARVSMHAGAFGTALELLDMADAGPLDEFASARLDLLRGQVAFASRHGGGAPLLLLKAAQRLESLDAGLARIPTWTPGGPPRSPGAWRAPAARWRYPGPSRPCPGRPGRPARPTWSWTAWPGSPSTARPRPARCCGRRCALSPARPLRARRAAGRLDGRQPAVGRRRRARAPGPAGPAPRARPARWSSCRSAWPRWPWTRPGGAASTRPPP